MKKSNSTSMISDLLHHHHGNGGERGVGRSVGGERVSHIGAGLQGRRNISTSNASLPGDIPVNIMPWASPIRRQPLASPLPLSRVNSPTSRQHRVEQLRKEESVDERVREVEQDREVTSQIHLNQSCVELKIDCDDDSRGGEMMMETLPSVAITTTPFPSPSSPIYPSRVRSRSLTPTSPSSTRSFTWRSLSPVPMRPSSLCFEHVRKRKRNQGDQEEMDISPTQLNPPTAKRSIYASPLTLSPPFSTFSNSAHQNDVRSPSVFDSLVTSPAVPRPVPYYETVPTQQYCLDGVRKGVNLSENMLSLNSTLSQDSSAFLPFKCNDGIDHTQHIPHNHTHHIPHGHAQNSSHNSPAPNDKEAGKGYDGMGANFHPVTTIS